MVAKGGKATLLTADSGGGKTTIVLALVQRGYHFLSDELAPLTREGGYIDPFPRCLRLRPDFHQLLGLSEPPQHTPVWFDKYLLDIEMLKQGSLGTRSNIANVVIIAENVNKSSETVQRDNEMGVFVNRLDTDLIAAVRKIPDIFKVWQSTELGYPVLRFQAEKRMHVLSEVEEICKENGILIMDISKRPLIPPSFSEPVRLVEIPRSQAVFELIHQFQPGHKSKIISDTYQDQASQLYIELAGKLDNVGCYQLIPGALNDMADIICQLDG